jgi:serine/threonine protein kinase
MISSLDRKMGTTPGKPAGASEAEPHTGSGGVLAAAPAVSADVEGESRRVKTGLTGSGSPADTTPTPPPPSALASQAGLHAKVLTPGPVVQHFVTLGRYQLLSRLAVGGMAEVYLARQGELSGFKTLVVVKKVLPHLAQKPDFINMFLDEARIASMLDHPNVVRISEVGRTETEYFLAMELVQGKALAAILQQGERAKTPLPHTLGALIVANAAAGLHHAHQLTDGAGTLLHLVHRDVSPQNVMVSFEGSVKVIDFGIARALGRLGDTSSGSLKGKLGYMAPEQARGEPIDARADIFSLGVVLWECIAGRRLFLRENELATLRAVVYEPIPKVSTYAKVDPVLEIIIEHALARDLEERFQTAEEMRIALERWVFASGGASTHDLSVLMKSWFPSDHVQWQRAARLALDMQESDPPIDMAFPDLAASKGLGSKTGTSRPGSSGSGNRNRPDGFARGVSSQIVPMPGLPVTEGPPQSKRFAVVIGVIALLVVAAVAIVIFSFQAKPPPPPFVSPQPTPTVRPTVETLPPAGTPAGEKRAAPKSGQEPSATHVGGPTPTQQPGTAEERNPSGKKRIRGTSGEKRAILREDGTRRRGSSDGKRDKHLRPNPF